MANKIKTQSILIDFYDKGILNNYALSFLCSKSNYSTILEEQEILDDTKLFFETGLDILNSSMPLDLKLIFLEKTNYLGYVEDRHDYNFYIFQMYIKKIVDLASEDIKIYSKHENIIRRISKKVEDNYEREIDIIKMQLVRDRTPFGSNIKPIIEDTDTELLAKAQRLIKLKNEFGTI